MGAVAEFIESCALPHPLRVAVDGRTASGKTILADEVATVLRSRGLQVIRTSVDGFHRPRAERHRRGRHSPEGYLEDARDWGAIRQLLLDPLGPDGDRWYRTATFDLERDEPIAQSAVRAEPSAVAIVDGTFLQRDELADAWDFAVFVEVSESVAVSRGAARDAAHLGGMAAARECTSGGISRRSPSTMRAVVRGRGLTWSSGTTIPPVRASCFADRPLAPRRPSPRLACATARGVIDSTV